MGKIKKILEKELGSTQSVEVYPVTSIEAVYDENNERLDSIINRKNKEIQKELEAEVTRASNAESNLRETINNITEINENATSANIVTIDNIPNTSASNVQQALNELFENDTCIIMVESFGTDAPETPTTGMYWYDTTNKKLKKYSGTEWSEETINSGNIYVNKAENIPYRWEDTDMVAFSAQSIDWLYSNVQKLSSIIEGIDYLITEYNLLAEPVVIEGYYKEGTSGKFKSNSNSKIYVCKLNPGDIVTFKGNLGNSYPICVTTTDLTGMSADEIITLNPLTSEVYRNMSSTTNPDETLSYTADSEIWILCSLLISWAEPIITVYPSYSQTVTKQNEIDDEVTELYRTLGYTSRFREKDVKIFKGYLNYWGNTFISSSNYRTIFVNLKRGQGLIFTGKAENSRFCAVTQTDLSELSADEIVSQWTSFESSSYETAIINDRDYLISDNDKNWFAISVRASLVNEVKITGLKEISDNRAIREELIGKEITTIYTGKVKFTRAQNYLSFGILVSLGSADSVDISMHINQSTAYPNVLHCEKSGCYRITSPNYFIDNVSIVFNGTQNKESYVKIFEDKIGAALQERTRVFNNWDNYNAQTDVFLQDSLDYYRVVNRAYNSYKTLQNTNATLKKINKSSYTYAHVSMFKIKGDSVYLAHLQNTSSAGEEQTSNTYELVLQKFSLTRYESSDWNPDTDVTSLVLGKLGTSYTTASGDTIETVRIPGDHAIELVGDYLYIVHGVRPVVGDETIISYKYDTNSDSIVSGSTNICKLSYKGEEVDMTCSNFIKLLKADGYFSTGSATMHMSSQFVSYSEWYYNTLVTTDINTYGALVRTQDFINYELVSIIPFNKYGTDEIILGINGSVIIVACRQKYGKTYMMMGYFNASNKSWIAWHKLPAGNTRPWIWTNNNTVYMMYPISESDRSRYQIVKNRTTNNSFIEWENVCTIETNWDYPCMLVSNKIVYFSCSTNNRTQVKFGKLMLSNVDKMAKLIQLLDS